MSRTDANGHTTTYAYDEANRLARVTNLVGAAWAYRWDATGNLVEVTDANGNATTVAGDGVTAFAYDEVNRLIGVDYSDTTPDVAYGYDPVGNLTRMTDGAGVETYGWDDLGRLVEVARGGDVFSYAWDAADNLTRRTYPDGTQVNLSWDADGRLKELATGGATTAYAWDAAGNLTEAALRDGTSERRTYDRVGRLSSVRHDRGATVVSRYQYRYDQVGNPTRMDSPEGLTRYAYDLLDRLTEVCYATSCSEATSPFIRWRYDAVGNRLAEERPEGTTAYTYDDADRLLTRTGHLGEVTTYAHDHNGNMTTAGGREMAYDASGRITSVTEDGKTTEYAYDGVGKRLRAATPSSTTEFLWDVTSALPEMVLERDGAGSPVRRYVYGANLISMETGASTYGFHHDGLGSVVGLTGASGDRDRVANYAYEPFGDPRTPLPLDGAPPPENPMGFTGEYQDPTGLYHLRARQYDPALGRFTAPDPLASPQAEPYVASSVYVANRPTVLVDPSGMRGDSPWVGAIKDWLRDPVKTWQEGCLELQDDNGLLGRGVRLLSLIPPNDQPGEMMARGTLTGSIGLSRVLGYWGLKHGAVRPHQRAKLASRSFLSATFIGSFVDWACRMGT